MFRPTQAQATSVVVCLLMTVATAAFADDPPPLEPGAWVRATVVDTNGVILTSRNVTGTLISLDSTTVTIKKSYEADYVEEIPLENLSEADYMIEIPRENIINLETRIEKSKKTKGALIGLGAGAVLGYFMGLAGGDDSSDEFFSYSAETKAAVGAVFFGLTGAIIGSAVSPGDQWQEIPDDKVHLGFGLSPVGGSGIFLTRNF